MTQEININNLHFDEDGHVLKCDCSRKSFSVFYTGTVKRRLFETVIEPKDGILIIKASCINCRKIFKVCDYRTSTKSNYHFEELEFKGRKNVYGIRFKHSDQPKVKIKGDEIIIYCDNDNF